MSTRTTTTDVVVIGAGHNALITAGYLVKAGLSVTVLEARDVVGGGSVTEELTLPGFHHDSASSGHIGIQFNPLIARDELGLLGRGLQYVAPDPVAVIHDGDLRPVVMWLDEDRTAAQLDSFHPGDGRAYRDLLADWRSIADIHVARMAGAPGEVADSSAEAGARWLELAGPSAWDTAHDRFTDDRSRLLILWLASLSTQPITAPGTGLLAVALPGMMSQVSWTNAIGGAGSLATTLSELVTSDGRSAVLTGQRAARILVDCERAIGVETASGDRFLANEAVVSAAHTAQLAGLVPEQTLPAEFDSLEHWRAGASMFVVHLALDTVPTYRFEEPRAVVAGSATLDGLVAQAEDIAAGQLSGDGLWLLGACSSVVDTSRAPGGGATLKVLTAVPYALEGDPTSWESAKEGYADQLLEAYAALSDDYVPGSELARTIHTPVDFETWNINNVRGGHQGGEMTPDQMGPNRPVKGWSGYRLPFQRLFQTGSTTHPGGTISGFSGRNAARVVLSDLGIDPDSVMGQQISSPSEVRA